MKVVWIAPVVPWPLERGGALRTFHLAREAARSVALELWCVRQPGADLEPLRAALAPDGVVVRGFERGPPSGAARMLHARRERWFHAPELTRALAAQSGADLVQLDEPCLIQAVPPRCAGPLVVQHPKLDLEFAAATLAGPRAALERLRLARMERSAVARAAAQVLATAEDAARLRSRHPAARTVVVPNGVDRARPAPAAVERERTLLFLGALDYEPNVEALLHFARASWPSLRAAEPELELCVAGSGAGERLAGVLGPRARLVGRVEDARAEFARAGVVIVPLCTGGGSRLKILEALSCGAPLVSTPVGAEGLGLRHGEHLLLADSPAEFSAAVRTLLRDPVRAARLGAAGRDHVLSRCGWDQCAAPLVELWTALATRTPRRASVEA